MKKNDVLYQIKAFDKSVFRYFIQVSKIKMQNFSQLFTPTQLQIMEYLIQHDTKEVLQRDLEEILHLRRATVSGVLQTMEKNHLIDRVPVKEDARIKKIVLHSSARKLYLERVGEFEALGAMVTKGISKRELAIFEDILHKMHQNLEDVMNKSCPDERKEFIK